MSKAFASQADMQEKTVSFDRLSDHAYAYTAEGDPNTGIVVGDNAVLVADTQATPVMAQDVLRRIRGVTDKPVRYVVLTHYHAVRVLGASGYEPREIIASQDTYDLIVERGAEDMQSEIERFPRLFRAVESVPGLTWPTMTFRGEMTLWLGKLEVKLMQVGRGHTKGDTIVWLPEDRILFSGDLVEYGATPYAGDAYFRDWPKTLDALAALQPEKLVPGRGPALTDRAAGCRRPGQHAGVRQRALRRRFGRRARRQGPARDLRGHVCGVAAEIRPLGDLRPLPAVRRDARVRRGDRASRSADLDGRARPGDVARAGGLKRRVRERFAMSIDYQKLALPYAPPAECRAAGIAHRPVIVVGGGPVGLTLAIDSPATARQCCCSTRTTSCRAAHARSASPSARWRYGTASAAATAIAGKGVSWKVGKVFFRRPARLCVRPAARSGPLPSCVRQPAAVLRRGLPLRPRARAAEPRDALEEQGRRASSSRADCALRHRRDAGRTLSICAATISSRATARARRCAKCSDWQSTGQDVSRPVPDRRRANGCRPADRAALLVRSAVSLVTAPR